MLNIRLQVALVIICLAALVYLINRIRSRRLDTKYALPWLALDLLMLIMTLLPQGIVWLSRFLGILTPSNLVFLAALLFLLAIVFLMSRTISRLNNEVKELAQRIALDEAENNVL